MSEREGVRLTYTQHFAWDCPACKARCWATPIVAEFSEQERNDYLEAHGEKPEPGAHFVAPGRVKCFKCGRSYSVAAIN